MTRSRPPAAPPAGPAVEVEEPMDSQPNDAAFAIRAKWLVPVDADPIEGGVLTVRNGWIESIGANTSGRAARDLGDVIVFPAWVNAHTHLEFSSLSEPLGTPGAPFPDWIRQVVAHRRRLAEQYGEQASREKREQAVRAGLRELEDRGCGAVGEIASLPADLAAYREFAGAAVVFGEALGLGQDDRLLEQSRLHLDSAADAQLLGGVNPHAPYTVSWAAMSRLAELSARRRRPLALHLAESPEELELLASGCGGLVDLLTQWNVWRPDCVPRGLRPLDYLKVVARAHRGLIIHGNLLSSDELRYCAQQRERLTIVYCPRTQARLLGARYPLEEMVELGLPFALGTDSRASNPDLDPGGEVAAAARLHPAVSPAVLLRAATLEAARGLGLERRLGSLTAGKRAAWQCLPANGGGDVLEQIVFAARP